MKVYPDKLSANLKQSLQPIYIVSGDEPLLVQESADVIRETLKKQGFLEREVYHVEGSFDWEQVLFSANSMSLFADQKIIELRIPNGKPGDKGGKALQAYCQNLPADTVLLVVLPKLDKPSQNSKWFKTIEAQAAFVQIWPIEVAKLPAWIQGRFKKLNLNASTEAVAALANRIEGNLLAGVQEIERLRLIADDGQIELKHIEEGVSDSSRFDVFSLLDAAVGQQPGRSIKIIHGLRSENAELMFILSMFGREIRGLVTMATALSQGQSMDVAFKAGRVWGNRQALVGRCLKRKKLKVLQSCLQTLAKIDSQVKGLAQGDPWIELERVTLRLSA